MYDPDTSDYLIADVKGKLVSMELLVVQDVQEVWVRLQTNGDRWSHLRVLERQWMVVVVVVQILLSLMGFSSHTMLFLVLFAVLLVFDLFINLLSPSIDLRTHSCITLPHTIPSLPILRYGHKDPRTHCPTVETRSDIRGQMCIGQVSIQANRIKIQENKPQPKPST